MLLSLLWKLASLLGGAGFDKLLGGLAIFLQKRASDELARFQTGVAADTQIALAQLNAQIEARKLQAQMMQADRGWTCEGLVAAVRIVTESDGSRTLDVLVRIPFFALERATPGHGETWRANFFRIDRHPVEGDEMSAWQPTMRQPPDFHVAAAFGTLRFIE